MSSVLRSLVVMVGADFSSAQKGLKQASKELKKAGKDFQNAGSALNKGLTVPIAGAAAGMAAMTISAGKAADELITLSNKTGISTDQLQEMEYAARFIDVELETMTSSMIKLTKNMDNARRGTQEQVEAFEALGVEYKNTDGTLRNAKDVWRDVINALGNMASEADRDAYALRLFGRSAAELNPLIVAGGDALDYYAKEAHAMGAVVKSDTVRALGAFDDRMQQLQAAFKAARSEIAAAFLPVFDRLKPVIENKVIPAIKNLATWVGKAVDGFNELSPATQKMIVLLGGVAAGLGPTMTLLGKASMALSTLASNAAAAAGALAAGKGLAGAVTAFLGPAGVAAAAIAGLALVVGGLVIAYREHNKEAIEMRNRLKETADAIEARKKQFAEQNEELETNTLLARKLADELYTLNEREKKSAADKARMKDIVAQLNEMYEGLNLSINEETWQLNLNKRAIEDNILAQERQIRLSIYGEQMTALLKEQVRLQEDLNAATEYRNKVWAETWAQVKDSPHLEAMLAANKQWQEAVMLQEQAAAALTANKDEYEKVSQEYQKAAGAAADANDELAARMAAQAEEQAQLWDLQQKDYEEHLKDLENATEKHYQTMGGIHDRGIKQDKITAAEVRKNLEQQVKDYQAWLNEIKKLPPQIPAAFREELINMGPQNTQLIRDINSMAEKELAEFVKVWEEKSRLAREAATAELSGITLDVRGEISNINSELTKTGGIRESAWQMGVTIGMGLKGGIESQKDGVIAAARAMTQGALREISRTGEIRSPSRVTQRFGRMIDEGLIVGIRDKARDAMREAGKLASGVVGAFRGLGSGLPSTSYGSPAAGLTPALAGATAGGGSVGSADLYTAFVRALRDTANDRPIEARLIVNGREFVQTIGPDIDRELAKIATTKSRGGGV